MPYYLSGPKLKKLRKLVGYTQVQMSELLGMTQQNYSCLEAKYSRARVLELADLLKCKPKDLILKKRN